MKRLKSGEVTQRVPLAVKQIAENILVTRDDTWAWYVLPSTRWSFQDEAQRDATVVAAARRYTALSGHELHLRVTSRPYPTDSWATALDELTPMPLPGWEEWLENAKKHQRATTMAEKQVFLGVKLKPRSMMARLIELGGSYTRPQELSRVLLETEKITQAIEGDGFGGRPAKQVELEWLLHRSIAVGLPAGTLSVVEGEWTEDDITALGDCVQHSAVPFGRTVKITDTRDGRTLERFVCVLTLGRTTRLDTTSRSKAPWQASVDNLSFPVEWSSRIQVKAGADAKAEVNRQFLRLRDQKRHYQAHDIEPPPLLDRAAKHAIKVEDEMTDGSEVVATRTYGYHTMAVSGKTEQEALDRARRVIRLFHKREWDVHIPQAQWARLRSFIPGEKLELTDYKRRMPALYLAAGLPTTSATLGDKRGPQIGYTVGSSRRAVMYDTHYATEVREMSGGCTIIGRPGSGKSTLVGAIVASATQRSILSTVFDPSGLLARLTEMTNFRDHARHVDLAGAISGILNPFVVVADPDRALFKSESAYEEARIAADQTRRLLAADVIKMLLPADQAKDGRVQRILIEATRQVGGRPEASLWDVVENLEARAGDDLATSIGSYLRDISDFPRARLLFSAADQEEVATLQDPTLLVMTMSGLQLPDPETPRELWSVEEQFSVPLLNTATYLATQRVYGRTMGERKLIALDEVHWLQAWPQGRALLNRLTRDSRKWNTWVGMASQNPDDVLGMDVSNLVSSVFVGSMEDEETAASALKLLKVRRGAGYESVLTSLPHRGDGPNFREFVMRDVDGNVEKFRVDLSGQPELMQLLNTTPQEQRKRSEEITPA